MLSRAAFSRNATARLSATARVQVGSATRARGPTTIAQGARFQSTTTGSGAKSFDASHVAAGFAGGLGVVLIGYAYYHTSGLKTAAESANQMKEYMAQTRDRVIDSARSTLKNPNQAISYLRNTARQYTIFVPGSQTYVDSALDSLEEMSESHGEKFVEIVNRAREELVSIYDEGKSKAKDGKGGFGTGLDKETAGKVGAVLKRTIKEIQELTKDIGGDVLEKHPQLKEVLGSGYGQLKQLAQKGGPEGKKILDETVQQLQDISTKGFNSDSLEKAKKLVQEKTDKLKQMVGSVSDGSGLDEGWESLQSIIKSVPGGEEALEKAPHIKNLAKIAHEKGDEATKLAKETYRDVMKVLEEKGKKAEKIARDGARDAEEGDGSKGK